jgi:GntR family transcriptional regulator
LNNLSGRIQVDFRSDEPLFLQIARQVQGLVLSGALKVGDQLPTVRELATELRVNFNTVARAYRLLDEARLISTQRGRGTYIWEEPTPQVMEELRQKSLQEVTRNFLREVHRLGFTPDQARAALESAAQDGETDLSRDEETTIEG